MSLTELIWLVAPPLCWGCGAAIRGSGPICGRCRAGLRWLGPAPAESGGVPVWAPLAYDGAARALVGGLKYRGAAGLADGMAAALAAGAPDGWLRPPRVLVPAPLHRRRRRRRGYNQAELLARALARRTGLRVDDCLVRAAGDRAQVGRNRAERLAGPAGRIGLRRGAQPPAEAVIVDDVITTGATIAACAAALRGNGALRQLAVAYARTPGR